ncbi:antibiotic biosynthesis monooxygenase [Deinococcus sp.]|uniref:antibiotic biosynthesis monooxygenase n=1 Tax=Deinococcus sp. TaxID=47478 RepID=UPI003C7C6A0F
MTEPLVLINLFTLPPQALDPFVAGWPASTAGLAHAPGFRGTRLHRAVSPDSPYQIVNVAQWNSAEDWRAALSGFQPGGERRRQAEAGGFNSEPALYRVVSATPDPLAGQAGDGQTGAGEPLTLINVFTLPEGAVDAFVAAWPANIAAQTHAPGFRGTRLHRAVSPDAPHQLVNIAHWDSAAAWEAATAGWRGSEERRGQADEHAPRAEPALYRVVWVTPDPLAATSSTQSIGQNAQPAERNP